MAPTHPIPLASPPPRVALETTLLVHGVPESAARPLAARLGAIVRARGARPELIGVVDGRPVVGLTEEQLDRLLARAGRVVKVNTANLGLALHRRRHAATTVSTTMELAAGAGISVFATGGIGGVHPPPPHSAATGGGDAGSSTTERVPRSSLGLDISSDLVAFTRFPVAVVTSGCKSILDLAATREMLETLGVPVVGFRTDEFPAFYLRRSDGPRVGGVDERFEDAADLAAYLRHEMARTGRGVVVCNPIPVEDEIRVEDWRGWLAEATRRSAGAGADGRDVTPILLAALHEVSAGATLRANMALVESNAALAADLAREMVAVR